MANQIEGLEPVAVAKKAGLIQLTEWVMLTHANHAWLKRDLERISSKSGRQAMICRKGNYMALWVNDVTGR